MPLCAAYEVLTGIIRRKVAIDNNEKMKYEQKILLLLLHYSHANVFASLFASVTHIWHSCLCTVKLTPVACCAKHFILSAIAPAPSG
jgi:hypothetical protein